MGTINMGEIFSGIFHGAAEIGYSRKAYKFRRQIIDCRGGGEGVRMQAGGRQEMKRIWAEVASPAAVEISDKVSSAPLAEEVLAGWAENGGMAEIGDLLWPLCGIEEEKLSGWFPFVDADFLCSKICQGEEGLGDHDIWQL
ncbi:hypothetical protein ZIOFF_010214 [Zingiber officinale]|uniref:Uncharacterized protein n=1 Tax=Zingiber officinale TaxID=94328 RepID=A0A8J5I3V7_ZINOF|nr:hypothetical protein ZIOFF_010214 [Zingiber officinale]